MEDDTDEEKDDGFHDPFVDYGSDDSEQPVFSDNERDTELRELSKKPSKHTSKKTAVKKKKLTPQKVTVKKGRQPPPR